MNCDIVVLEVGLGGRFDTTMSLKRLGIGYFTIGYDHMDRLEILLKRLP